MWRKTDTRYAAATAAALGLVAFIVAGNFGLVPSPIALGAERDEFPQVTVLAADGQPGNSVGGNGANPVLEAIVLGGTQDSVTPPGPTAPPAPPGDSTPPNSEITTPSGVLPRRGAVEGTAADAGSGIAEVSVTFALVGAVAQPPVSARLNCDSAMRSCMWEADAPLAAGNYEVTSRAIDKAGNVQAPPDGPVTVTVVTTAPLTGTTQQEDDGGLVEDLLDTTQSVVRTTGSLLSGTVGVLGGLLAL